MKLTAGDVPAGSYILRGWLHEEEGTPDSGKPIQFVALLSNLGGGHGRVEAALGVMTGALLRRLAALAAVRGFRTLEFKRKHGGHLGHWAVLVKTEGDFDYYVVDLLDQLEKYKRSF